MRKILGLVWVLSPVVVFLMYALTVEENSYKNATIIGVLPQHATRVEIVYKNEQGDFLYRSTHQSEIVTDGKTTINPHNYLQGYCKPNCKSYYVEDI